MKKFNIEKLPNWAKERIDLIEWNDGTLREENAGLVWLSDGYAFDFDGSTVAGFTNKRDLLDLLTCVVKTNS